MKPRVVVGLERCAATVSISVFRVVPEKSTRVFRSRFGRVFEGS